MSAPARLASSMLNEQKKNKKKTNKIIKTENVRISVFVVRNKQKKKIKKFSD
jgi:predicted RNA-binding protein with PUA-like domain